MTRTPDRRQPESLPAQIAAGAGYAVAAVAVLVAIVQPVSDDLGLGQALVLFAALAAAFVAAIRRRARNHGGKRVRA